LNRARLLRLDENWRHDIFAGISFSPGFFYRAANSDGPNVTAQLAGEFSMRPFIALLLAFFFFPTQALQGMAQEQASPSPEQAPKLTLKEAVMAERVENLTPVNPGLVFSVSSGQVCCYTSFDPVPQHTIVYHRWFRRDELSTQTRLRLYPAKWATYSVIQLRETDKGPWRVEIIDQNGRVFDVLRFSITD
jgi:hypothetical protein